MATPPVEFFEKGKAFLAAAAEKDRLGQAAEALENYDRGISCLLVYRKYEKNPTAKAALEERLKSYFARAEQLKEIVRSGNGAPPANGDTAVASRSQKKDKKDEDDGESAKMRGALEGAIVREKPNVKWTDVAGLEGAKEALHEAVIFPVKYPQFFHGKITPWKGILLYGPPGTGKSYLAKAVATEVDSTFFSVSSSDLVSKWQGESEKLISSLFRMAREAAPSIIFIDEIDSLCSARSDSENDSTRRIKTEFLVQMQGVGNNTTGVLVLAATNLPWALDPAMLRRFERRVYIPLPDQTAREAMFRIHVGDTKNNLQPEDIRELARRTEGYSGSDVQILVRDALYQPMRRVQHATHFRQVQIADPESGQPLIRWVPCSPGDPQAVPRRLYELNASDVLAPPVSYEDFLRAVESTPKSVSHDQIGRYDDWTREFGQEGR